MSTSFYQRVNEAIRINDAAYTSAATAPLRLHGPALCPERGDLAVSSSVATLSHLSNAVTRLQQRLCRVEVGLENVASHTQPVIGYSEGVRGVFPVAREAAWVRGLIDEALEPLRGALQHQERLIMDIISTLNYAVEWGLLGKVAKEGTTVESRTGKTKATGDSLEYEQLQLQRRIARLKELAVEVRMNRQHSMSSPNQSQQQREESPLIAPSVVTRPSTTTAPSSSSPTVTTPSPPTTQTTTTTTGTTTGSSTTPATTTTPTTTTTTGERYTTTSSSEPAFRRLVDLSAAARRLDDSDTGASDPSLLHIRDRGRLSGVVAAHNDSSALAEVQDILDGPSVQRSVHFALSSSEGTGGREESHIGGYTTANTTGTTFRVTPLVGLPDATQGQVSMVDLGTNSLDATGAPVYRPSGSADVSIGSGYNELLRQLNIRST